MSSPVPSGADPLVHVAALPGVEAAVGEAREAVDRLRGHRVLRRYAERVTAESSLRGARASAALDGADLSLDVVRRTVRAGGRFPAPEDDVLQGALRVAGELGTLQGTWRMAPLQALARLHSLAAAATEDGDGLGRPRAGDQVGTRLAALAELVTADSDAPALVAAAVVHGELLALAPFRTANGVVARAASRLVLVTRGLDPAGVTAPEVGHAEQGPEAYARVAAGYVDGGPQGLAAWVRHCAQAVVLGAREGTAVCEAIQRGA